MSKKLAESSAAKVGPSGLGRRPAGYAEWLADVKDRVRAAQQRADYPILEWRVGQRSSSRAKGSVTLSAVWRGK